MQIMTTLCFTYSECSEDPRASVEDRVKSMGEIFCEAYALPCNNIPASQVTFAQNRLQFASMLYYKVLESIMSTERKRLKLRAPNKPVDLSVSSVSLVSHVL